MKGLHILLLTKRKDPYAPIFKKISEAVTPLPFEVESPDVHDLPGLLNLKKLIEDRKPHIILVDGYYGTQDKRTLEALRTANREDLRLRLAPHLCSIPVSVSLLHSLRTVRKNEQVIFFTDNPGVELTLELMWAGATTVYGSLDNPSQVEGALFDTLFKGKDFVKSAVGLGKALSSAVTAQL